MTASDAEVVALHDQNDVVQARHRARDLSVRAGLGLVAQTKLVTAVSELARNAVVHGGGGSLRVESVTSPKPGVRVTVSDQGPGIPDVDRAMVDGWTSGSGLGLGLSGSRRLVDDFDLRTSPEGTEVTIAMWL